RGVPSRSSIARADGNGSWGTWTSCPGTWTPCPRSQPSRAEPPQPWVLPRSLRRARQSLPIVGGRTREITQPAGIRCLGSSSATRQGVSVYEQNPAAAKRASRRLDEYGRRLERLSNQPTRGARRLSGDYPG